MSLPIMIAFTYLPFVVFSAFSCTYEGKTAKFFKSVSLIFLFAAFFFYVFFIKSLFNY